MADESKEDKTFKTLIGDSVSLLKALGNVQDGISDINRGLGETRTRYLEFSTAVSDNVADFVRLGGQAKDVSTTIVGIAAASRRNVVATQETLLEIFATSKVLGITAKELTESFAIAGVEMSNIAEATEESIKYIQSIGLNASTIMGDVAGRMELMNRFNFEGGVLGLSKMAAQASMLRFDMSETMTFADKVLNPEGAIKMAAAFQRLGVASGDLVNPFTLMDKSINDPKGLQDSIIQMTKQFTYFNEETGNFSINPGGVRLLKEIAEETGISFENMTKTALAAADMDRRLGQISFGIQGSEEDKMLVANMAKMGENRKFEVEFQDEDGKRQTKALEDLSQAQFEQIKEQQALRPETMEDIARAQLDTDVLIKKEIEALPMKIGYALAGQSGLVRGIESMREGFENFATKISDTENKIVPSTAEFRKAFEGAGETLKKAGENYLTGTGTMEDIKVAIKESLQSGAGDLGMNDRLKNLISAVENIESGKERFRKLGLADSGTDSSDSFKMFTAQQREAGQSTVTGQVDINGDINIKVDAPTQISEQQIFNIFNSPEIKDQIFKIVKARTDVAIKDVLQNPVRG